MPATEAPAERDDQNRKETHAKSSNASRSHESILAAGEEFDK